MTTHDEDWITPDLEEVINSEARRFVTESLPGRILGEGDRELSIGRGMWIASQPGVLIFWPDNQEELNQISECLRTLELTDHPNKSRHKILRSSEFERWASIFCHLEVAI